MSLAAVVPFALPLKRMANESTAVLANESVYSEGIHRVYTKYAKSF